MKGIYIIILIKHYEIVKLDITIIFFSIIVVTLYLLSTDIMNKLKVSLRSWHQSRYYHFMYSLSVISLMTCFNGKCRTTLWDKKSLPVSKGK